MSRLILTPEAEREAREAFVWYWERNPKAGDDFEAELMATLNRIVEMPGSAPEVEAGIRRMLLHRFPYSILYSLEPEGIIVLAIMHQRRRPGYWRNRKP